MGRTRYFRLRRSAVLALAVNYAFSSMAFALPQGAVVANGQVGISQPSAGVMQVTASNGAIINWKQFSIGAGEITRFLQPTASSAVLNRVIGQDVSQILGQLQANGRVFLINPNGIVIGAGARIDTNGFVASTLNMTDADFLAGKLRFAEAGTAGSLINQGLIVAGSGGRVALIAPNIENSGIIQAPGGQILLAAGRKIEIASMDFEGVTFEIQAPTDTALNLGKLLADNGAVKVFAGNLRQSGEIRADRLVQDADGSVRLVGSNEVTLTAGSVTRADGMSGGEVVVQSTNGTTRVTGAVSARGTNGSGGEVRLLGERVAVETGATVDVSGSSRGGQILVGGDYQGKNPDIQNAKRVFVGEGATLAANATVAGHGGRIIVWSDENTRFFGSLAARGGPQGGNGGFAEVSGKQNLQFAGTADLNAPAGNLGFLLLDPLDIIVSAAGGTLPVVVDQFADFPTNILTISAAGLNVLGGNVILQAQRDIFINSPTNFTGSTLTLAANGAASTGSIYVNQALTTSAGGALDLSGYTVTGSGGLSAGSVNIHVTGNLNYGVPISAGSVALSSSGGSISGANVNAGSGPITVSGQFGVYSGNYVTGGAVSLAAPAGSIGSNNVTAGSAAFTAASSIYSNFVNAGRVDATSTGSYVELYNRAGQPLHLGTINGAGGAYLHSDAGMVQASGGLITAPFVNLYAQNAAFTLGSAGTPLSIATPNLSLFNLASPAFIALAGAPTLSGLSIQGVLAGVAGTSISGAANLTTLSLSAGTGVLNAAAASSSGLGSGFSLNVSDAAINMSTLNMPGAAVSLTAGGGGVTFGAATVGSLNVSATGSITGTSVTGTGGITLSANKCSYFYPVPICTDTSNVNVGALTTTGGSVNLYTYDNGDITVSTLNASGSASIQGGHYPYYSYTDGNNHATTNNVNLGTVTTGSSFTVNHYGVGNVAISGPVTAGNSVNINAGAQYYNYALGHNVYTASALNVADVQGRSISLTNSGSGNVTVGGNLTATVSSLSVNAQSGAVSAAGTNSAGRGASFSAGGGALTLGTVTTANGSVTGNATSDITFQSIAANGTNRDVNLSASGGFIRTTTDNVGTDISATRNVTLSGNTGIGNGAFAHPLDIVAGSTASVSLISAGGSVGAAGKPVTVDTGGSVLVQTGGQFHVAVQDAATHAAKTLKSIDLTASAAGIGSGGTSVFSSQDLTVNASSDGTAITIGDIVQSANTLNAFKFNASGSSGLIFGDVNLTTATGFNDVYLSAGNGLTQTLPGTHNIVGGYVSLAGGSGAVTVGNVTSPTGTVGNAISISGGDITTGNLSALDIEVTGANLNLGAVASSGTRRGYPGSYVFVPRAGFSDYVTEDLHLTTSGSLTTAGNITSATSATVGAGTGMTVSGGAGSITGGNTHTGYYADTVNVNAGTGTLAANAIHAYTTSVAGNTLNTGALSAIGGSLQVSGTTFNTGNLTATGSVTINGTAGYVPGAIAISGSSVNVTAPAGIDTTAAALTTPQVTFSATGGQVKSNLTGTHYLTLTAGGVVNVTSDTALTNLYVYAKGDQFGGASAITGTGQNFQLATVGGTTANLTWASGSSIDSGYFEQSPLAALSAINLSANYAGGYLQIGGNGAAINANAVTGGNASFYFHTAGDINLNSVTTGGGYVIAASTAGNIGVNSVSTLGAAVDLTSSTGSIVGAGTATIDTANGAGASSGAVYLRAANGSVGGSGVSPITVNKTVDLTVAAKNDIALDMNGSTLTNLYLTTGASGTGAISILNNPNFAGFSLTRSAGDLVLGPVAPVSAGNFYLVATNGNIRVTGDINVAALKLDAWNSGLNATGDVIIQASGGPRNVTASGAAYLYAGRDIKILAGAAVGDNVTVQSGYLDSHNGNDFLVKGDGGSALLNLTSTSSQTISAGHDIQVVGGSNGVGASAGITSSGYQTLYATNDLIIRGGDSANASALVQAIYNQSVRANNLSVLGGGASGTSARFTGGYQDMTYISGNLTVQGGTGGGAFAEIVGTSTQYLGTQSTYATNPTDTVLIQGGSGSGAYASVRTTGSQYIYGSGTMTVQGGTGSGAYAEAAAGFSQGFGSQNQYFYDPTDGILVQGGSGGGAYASVRAGGSQDLYSGNDIRVLGGSGTGAGTSAACGTGPGAFAEICAGGSQTIGSTSSAYYIVPTANVLVQGGAGGNARILAGSSQTVMAGGDISVLAGTAANMTASIESTGGSQNIGYTYLFSNDPTGNIIVRGGTLAATGAAAWIRAYGSQTIDAGGTISLTGGAAGSFAEMSTAFGTQTIGNLNSPCCYDQTGAITLSGGSGAGAYAHMTSGGAQFVYSASNIALAGGSAGSTGALMQGGSSQSVTTHGSLSVLAGTGSDAEIRQTGGGTQTVAVTGSITVDNPGGATAGIVSGGAQSISATDATVTVSSGVASAKAEILAAGAQTLTLSGTPTANGFLTILNHSGASGSLAQVATTGAQTVAMPYDKAGLLRIGDTASLGSALLSAGGVQTLLAGELIVQGGATAAASSKIFAAGNMDISTIGGSVSVLGGAAGSAAIDPPVLSLAADGGVSVIAGSSATATALISGGSIFLAATSGSITVTGGPVSGASASIVAAPGAATLFASGGATITPGVGGASIVTTTPGSITLGGTCTGCGTGLVGTFATTFGLLPVAATSSPVSIVDPSTGEVLALLDGLTDLYGMLAITEEGEIVIDTSRRRLPMCY